MANNQPMTPEQAATLKQLAQLAYELDAFKPNLTSAEADMPPEAPEPRLVDVANSLADRIKSSTGHVLAFIAPRAADGAAWRAMYVALGAVMGAAATWALFDRAAIGLRSSDRQSLEIRAQELTVRTLAPGSSLACLDALVGKDVEAACERAIFASPASVATATSYVAARLTLLSDIIAYVGRGGTGIDDVLLATRRSLEADRFGFLAHILAARDGCTKETCKALALLRDAGRVRENLTDSTLDRYLEHHQPVWAKSTDESVAEAAPVLAPAQAPRRSGVNMDFPSSSSIPAVSIMSAEPTGPALPGVAAAAAASPTAQQAANSSRRAHRQQPTNPPPQTVTQSAASGSPAIEPIWPEPVPAPPQPAVAPPPAASAPAQLSPFGPGPNGIAATAARQ
jgi:hypothetical protein